MIEYAEENHRYGNCERCGENPIDCKCKPVEKTQDEKIIEILDDPRAFLKRTGGYARSIRGLEYNTRYKTYYIDESHYKFDYIKLNYSYSYSHRGEFKPLSEV